MAMQIIQAEHAKNVGIRLFSSIHPLYLPNSAPTDDYLFRLLRHYFIWKMLFNENPLSTLLGKLLTLETARFYYKGIEGTPDKW